jgi:hypothetical protein
MINEINTNTVTFYEGSYQYNSIETELNISEDFVEMKLAQQIEERNSTEYWAEVVQDGIATRYTLDYGKGLVKGIKYNALTLDKI